MGNRVSTSLPASTDRMMSSWPPAEAVLAPNGPLHREQPGEGDGGEILLRNERAGKLVLGQNAGQVGDGRRRQLLGSEWQPHPVGDPPEQLDVRLVSDRGVRQRAQHLGAVGGAAQPFVEKDSRAPVGRRADQPAEALLEQNHHLRQQVVVEGVAAGGLDGVHSGRLDRVADAGVGQLFQEDVGQRLAGHVHAFPQRPRAEKRAGDLVAEALDQLGQAAQSLAKHGISLARQRVGDALVNQVARASWR